MAGFLDRRLRLWYEPADEAEEHTYRLLKRAPRARHYGGFNHGLGVAKHLQHLVLGPPDMGLAVAKHLQHAVLAPPDDSLGVAKHLQHLVLLPPDAALAIAKHLQHVVLETTPLPDMARPRALRLRLGWPEHAVEIEEPRGLSAWGQRVTPLVAYATPVLPVPAPFRRWLAGERLADEAEFQPRPIRVQHGRAPPRTDAFVPVIIVN